MSAIEGGVGGREILRPLPKIFISLLFLTVCQCKTATLHIYAKNFERSLLSVPALI